MGKSSKSKEFAMFKEFFFNVAGVTVLILGAFIFALLYLSPVFVVQYFGEMSFSRAVLTIAVISPFLFIVWFGILLIMGRNPFEGFGEYQWKLRNVIEIVVACVVYVFAVMAVFNIGLDPDPSHALTGIFLLGSVTLYFDLKDLFEQDKKEQEAKAEKGESQ
jgi:formate hydrogenlyase subunit 4